MNNNENSFFKIVRTLNYMGWLLVVGGIILFMVILSQTDLKVFFEKNMEIFLYGILIIGIILGISIVAIAKVIPIIYAIQQKVVKLDEDVTRHEKVFEDVQGGKIKVEHTYSNDNSISHSTKIDDNEEIREETFSSSTPQKSNSNQKTSKKDYDGNSHLFCEICEKDVQPELHEFIGYKCPNCKSILHSLDD